MANKIRNFSIIALISLALVVLAFSYFIRFSPKEAESVDTNNLRPNDGDYVSFFKNGQISAKEHYVNGKKEGFWTYYHPSGTIKKELNYQDNQLHGVSKYYNEQGELIYAERYASGVFSELTVVNDSLYKYEIQLLDHGTKLYKKLCSNCHQVEDISKFTKLTRFMEGVDSLGRERINFDSLHQIATDSVVFQSDTLFNSWIPKSGEQLFDKYDIEAILHYIEAVRNQATPLRFKSIRNLKKKPKIV